MNKVRTMNDVAFGKDTLTKSIQVMRYSNVRKLYTLDACV